jgi:Taurine catabolism dioxygenase TauD, TfdA family
LSCRRRIDCSVAIRNEIARTRPDLLAVLYQPFVWSLQNQHGSGDAPYYEQPLFTEHEGQFACRYIRTHIKSAQRYPEVPRLTAFHFEMMFEPGDVQILNNHVTLHARTRISAPVPCAVGSHRVAGRSFSPRARLEDSRLELNPRVPLIALVFPIAALAAGDLLEARDEFDALDVLRVLVAELPLHTQAHRCAVRNR